MPRLRGTAPADGGPSPETGREGTVTGGEPSSHRGAPGADPTAGSSRVSEAVSSSLSLDERMKQQPRCVTDM